MKYLRCHVVIKSMEKNIFKCSAGVEVCGVKKGHQRKSDEVTLEQRPQGAGAF